MTPNGINNQVSSFLDSIASKAKANGLGDKPLLEKQSNQGFDKVIDDTVQPQSNDKTSSRDSADIYKAAQKAIDKLEKYSSNNNDDDTDIKEDDDKDYKDVYFVVLNTAQTQIEDRIDHLTKQIAYLDLNSANGVEDILTKANLIEGLRNLEQGVQAALKELNALGSADGSEANTIDPGLMKDLGFQVDNFIQKSQEKTLAKADLSLAPDLKASDSQNPSYQDLALLKDLKHMTVKDYKEFTEDTDETNTAPLETLETILPKDNSKAESKTTTASKEPEILATESIAHNHDASHPGHQEQFGSALSNSSQIDFGSTDKVSTQFETVNINDLSNYLEDQVSTIAPNKTQEIKLQITPDSVGKVDLTITKNEHNQVSIEMSFHSKEGLDSVKQDLKNTIAELREVLKSKDLDLSKFEVKESNASRTAYDGESSMNSFNQAREEQKNKLQNTIPEWVRQKESSTKASFKQVIEGI